MGCCARGDSDEAGAGVTGRGSGRCPKDHLGRRDGRKSAGVQAGWVTRFDLGVRMTGANGEAAIWEGPVHGAVLGCVTKILINI